MLKKQCTVYVINGYATFPREGKPYRLSSRHPELEGCLDVAGSDPSLTPPLLKQARVGIESSRAVHAKFRQGGPCQILCLGCIYCRKSFSRREAGGEEVGGAEHDACVQRHIANVQGTRHCQRRAQDNVWSADGVRAAIS